METIRDTCPCGGGIPILVYHKIFGIGMNKTGTTSLKNCFKILGLHPIAPTPASSYEIAAATRRLFKKGEYAGTRWLCQAGRRWYRDTGHSVQPKMLEIQHKLPKEQTEGQRLAAHVLAELFGQGS